MEPITSVLEGRAAAPDASAPYMYVDNAGATKGPVPAGVLRKLLRKGINVSSSTPVWTGGMTEWLPMSKVDAFREEAELQAMSWYFVDPVSGEQKGPVPSRQETNCTL
jgi:hypothetical protein